jgi:hypothetical protein
LRRPLVLPYGRSVVFAIAQKLVAFDSGNDADGTFLARLGALDAAEAANFDGASQGDLVGQSEEDLNRRPLFNVFGKKEIHPAGANITGFRAGFANRCPGRPPHGKG